MHFSVACVAQRLTVSASPQRRSAVLEGGSGSGVRRYGGIRLNGNEGPVTWLTHTQGSYFRHAVCFPWHLSVTLFSRKVKIGGGLPWVDLVYNCSRAGYGRRNEIMVNGAVPFIVSSSTC